jgi:FAD/FMN-containing dehydrogenase
VLLARPGDSEYEQLREAAVWNGVVPDRRPAAIARPAARGEVAELLRLAREEGLRIAVKSGGHSWIAPALRGGALLIDLGELGGVEVDPGRRAALVEPAATHKVLADAIVPHGLAFPIGHCPTVGLGGYLLAGGYGWNPRTWGPACWSVEAIDLVDLEGRERRIDQASDPDLFWAGRGGGGAFPAIATRFHLRLQPLPRIASVRSDHPLELLPDLLAWSGTQAEMPPGTEISLIGHRPQGGEATATVQASGFGESQAEAMGLAREASDAAPDRGQRTGERVMPDVRLNDLEGEGAWAEGRRYAVDMCWVDGSYPEVGEICGDAVREAPSALSRIVLAWVLPPPGGPDVAQTANGALTVNLYGIWEDPREDEPNAAWIRATMERLEPLITGFYVGEADLSAAPDRPRRCYPAAKWERLTEVRRRHDPVRRKHGFLSED